MATCPELVRPQLLVRKTSQFSDFCLPRALFHGTVSHRLSAILGEGLRIDIGQKESIASLSAVYLITDIGMAAHMARSRAARHQGVPVVLEVDTSQLDADFITFDLNLSHRYWSQSIAYGATVPPSAIKVLPLDQALRKDDQMLFTAPAPGAQPIVFSADWPQAPDYLEYGRLPLSPTSKTIKASHAPTDSQHL